MIGEYIGLFVLVAIMGAGIPGPGDAALIAAGTLAGQGKLSLTLVLIVAGVAWMVGSILGYWIGAGAAAGCSTIRAASRICGGVP